jgi:activator of HSP90 ATPase
MTNKINFQNRNFTLSNKNYELIFLIIIFLFAIRTPLYSQSKQGSMENFKQDSTNNVIIHQEVDFKVNSQKLYHTLLNSKEFSASTKKSFNNFSESSATIDSVVGGTFTLFDGHIIGRILELVPNQRIVEAWRVVDWPAGVYSIVRFELTPLDSGSHLSFDHIGFPEGLKKSLANGWEEHYWKALNNYFQ